MSKPVLRLKQPQASRVQAPVDVFIDDLLLPLYAFDFRPTDAFDGFRTVEFAVDAELVESLLDEQC